MAKTQEQERLGKLYFQLEQLVTITNKLTSHAQTLMYAIDLQASDFEVTVKPREKLSGDAFPEDSDRHKIIQQFVQSDWRAMFDKHAPAVVAERIARLENQVRETSSMLRTIMDRVDRIQPAQPTPEN